MTWVETHSGRAVSYLVPDPDEITIEDIAVQLSRIPRFTGATRFFYSVAQHSLHVLQTVRDASPHDTAACLWALNHDDHEAYTGDLPTPLKHALREIIPGRNFDPVEAIQRRLDQAICKAFNIEWEDVEAVKPIVKRADMIALSTEKAQLMGRSSVDWKLKLPPPCEIELVQLSPANAEWLFRSEFERCLAAYHISKHFQRGAAE